MNEHPKTPPLWSWWQHKQKPLPLVVIEHIKVWDRTEKAFVVPEIKFLRAYEDWTEQIDVARFWAEVEAGLLVPVTKENPALAATNAG